MNAALIALLFAAAPEPQRFDPLDVASMEAMAKTLAPYVAQVIAENPPEKGQPRSFDQRDGFGVPIDDKRVAVLSFVVHGVKRARIIGPKGRAEAIVVLEDPARRVAILEAEKPLQQLGLKAPPIAPKESRKAEANVFALQSTEPEATVLAGEMLEDGATPELEGHPRSTLKLARGMPVFDDRARLIGYARAAAWDADPTLLVPPEMITAARTSTGAAAAPANRERTRPWWAK